MNLIRVALLLAYFTTYSSALSSDSSHVTTDHVDVATCVGIYVTLWDTAESQPPQTYIFSSQTYTLATPTTPLPLNAIPSMTGGVAPPWQPSRPIPIITEPKSEFNPGFSGPPPPPNPATCVPELSPPISMIPNQTGGINSAAVPVTNPRPGVTGGTSIQVHQPLPSNAMSPIDGRTIISNPPSPQTIHSSMEPQPDPDMGTSIKAVMPSIPDVLSPTNALNTMVSSTPELPPVSNPAFPPKPYTSIPFRFSNTSFTPNIPAVSTREPSPPPPFYSDVTPSYAHIAPKYSLVLVDQMSSQAPSPLVHSGLPPSYTPLPPSTPIASSRALLLASDNPSSSFRMEPNPPEPTPQAQSSTITPILAIPSNSLKPSTSLYTLYTGLDTLEPTPPTELSTTTVGSAVVSSSFLPPGVTFSGLPGPDLVVSPSLSSSSATPPSAIFSSTGISGLGSLSIPSTSEMLPFPSSSALFQIETNMFAISSTFSSYEASALTSAALTSSWYPPTATEASSISSSWFIAVSSSLSASPTAIVSAIYASLEASPTAILDPSFCGDGITCLIGNCCSRYNHCGNTPEYCDISQGCQPAWGNCTSDTSSVFSSNAALQSSQTSVVSSTLTEATTFQGQGLLQSTASMEFSQTPAASIPYSTVVPVSFSSSMPAAIIATTQPSSASELSSQQQPTSSLVSSFSIAASTTVLTSLSITTLLPSATPLVCSFAIVAANSGTAVDGVPLDGEPFDDYFVGFALPYGETDLSLSLDPTTGFIMVTGTNVALYAINYPGGDPPMVVTLNVGDDSGFEQWPLQCTVLSTGQITCFAQGMDTYNIFYLVNRNGDGNSELAIGDSEASVNVQTSVELFIQGPTPSCAQSTTTVPSLYLPSSTIAPIAISSTAYAYQPSSSAEVIVDFPPYFTTTPIPILSSTQASSPAPSSTGLITTTDGSCGNGFTCLGDSDGLCCSINGFCGSTDAYCGAGCQPEFGACGDIAFLASSATPIVSQSATPVPSSIQSSISVIPSASPTPTPPLCTSFAPSYDCGGPVNSFVKIYYGSCFTQNPDNPGNKFPSFPLKAKEYASADNAVNEAAGCATLADCTNWALSLPGEYWNVDLHLLIDTATTSHWECVAQIDQAGGGHFDIANSNVLVAYGYDFRFD